MQLHFFVDLVALDADAFGIVREIQKTPTPYGLHHSRRFATLRGSKTAVKRGKRAMVAMSFELNVICYFNDIIPSSSNNRSQCVNKNITQWKNTGLSCCALN